MTHTHTDHHHSHDHPHDHGDHNHPRHESVWGRVASALHLPGYGHTHGPTGRSDPLLNTETGIRTVKLALLILGITAVLQIAIYLASGSVALLADTVHNLGDALNSIPLWIAYALARRTANKRYTYGYGRAEDLAGVLIVVSIAFSAGYILYESIQKFINPQPLTNLPWVAGAALVGFGGNELVALMQIRVGQQIGSEAMVTDGRHARTDGLTSLAVLGAVGGTWLGFPILDPIIGILIGITIVFITRGAIIATWYRLMDAVEPWMVESAERTLLAHPGVVGISRLRLRWVGHGLYLDAELQLPDDLALSALADLRDRLKHNLEHALPNLSDGTISFCIAPVRAP